ncbi:MAG TPA: hypothetical protein PLK99_11245, partial [Burkholderiales bacterium]|nr:hypothetical protein [Burkholderiales bacterium]
MIPSVAQYISWGVTSDDRCIPISPVTGQIINAHDRQHWTTPDKCNDHKAFVFNGVRYFFVDIDDCLVDGKWSPLALSILAMFPGAYMEVSRSGTGLHIIGTARTIPAHLCKNAALHIELYTDKRFCALTGTHAQG